MKLYSWGANSSGQLSQGFESEQCLFATEVVTFHSLKDVAAMSGGARHTLVLDSTGSVFGAGSNSHGQLANCANNTTALTRLHALEEYKIASIECGWDCSYAITSTGSVMVWGCNMSGQLGISKGIFGTRKHPEVLAKAPPIVQVSAGMRHAAMVSSDGQVFTCGEANKGQLGVLTADGSLPNRDCDFLVKVKGVENVCQVACGQQHTLALTADGKVYGWGNNSRGQLGEGPKQFLTPRLITVSEPGANIRAGWTHSAVLSGGKVTTWGRNTYGQLGHSLGQKQVYKPTELAGLQGVTQLELGSEHNLALLGNGEVWSWGWNEHGNCGTGTEENVAVPRLVHVPSSINRIAAGAGFSLALRFS